MRRIALIAGLLVSALALWSCSKAPDAVSEPEPVALPAPAAAQQPPDPFSFANTAEFTTRHLELDLTVDFERQILEGSAALAMQRLSPTAREVLLDTRGLDIDGVSIEVADQEPVQAVFDLLPPQPRLGQALAVVLPEEVLAADAFDLRIAYRTRPESTALQWLAPELTAGGKQPFLFSQSQSIHARSWVPLQDTPSVRITYGATIRTPEGLLAVMSADNDPDTARDGEYRFEMPQPIPSYLLAIAVGDLWFAPLGERTGIYAEKELLQSAAWEFADTQAMLEAAEQRYGPYQWGRYDLLILPPSFPFGGMENPRLSFITPSVLAGDRSLVSLIAHELAHSWSGNLVTNATWSDIWLNEGMTSYLDARLTEVLYGQERADEERYLSYQGLLSQLQTVKPAMQALAPDLSSASPDDSQGTVHYAKGQLFLEHLEAVFGRERFDAFLGDYFHHFQWQSITSAQFLDYLDQHLLSTEPRRYPRARAEEWVYGPGIPADATLPHSTTLEAAASIASAWALGELPTPELSAQQWSPQAIVQFINSLPPQVSDALLAELDTQLQLSATRNAEIGRAWFIQVAARGYRDAYPALRTYLQRNGRIRLVAPVYVALARNGQDAGLAREIFDTARSTYHPITVTAIDRRLASATNPDS